MTNPAETKSTDSLKIRLRELDEKGYQPSTGAIGREAADWIEKAEARNKRLAELLGRAIGSIGSFDRDLQSHYETLLREAVK